MELYIADAFTNQIFGGNQAGVVLLHGRESFPEDSLMQSIASELRYSETAFVLPLEQNQFELKYFTPEGEVPLCGHATVATFSVLRNERNLPCGAYTAITQSGKLSVSVEPDLIWLEMPKGQLIRYLSKDESDVLYRAYGLNPAEQSLQVPPAIVKVGLADILLPVGSKQQLDHAIQNRDEVSKLSKEYQVVGAHLYYCPQNSGITAYCRNFAPLFGIDEECATGTSNASLTFLLAKYNQVEKDKTNKFLQGEAMGKPSSIYSRIDESGIIQIGGNAVISVKGYLNL